MHTHRFLKATAIAAVSLALIGCSDDNDNGVSSDAQEVLDTYSASFNEADADAFLAVVTDDFTFRSEFGELDAAGQAAAIDELGTVGWSTEQTGDGIMVGDGPWYVSYPNMIDDDMMNPVEGLSTFIVVDDSGTLKVAQHTFTYDFSTDTEPSAPATTVAAPGLVEKPATTAAPAAPVIVTAGLWIEAVVVPPVAVCLFVSQDGTTLTEGPECNGGLEVEFEAVPGCPNGRLSIKGSVETPIEGDKAVVTDANGTATVPFISENAATVVATSAADPACTHTFENVTPGIDEPSDPIENEGDEDEDDEDELDG